MALGDAMLNPDTGEVVVLTPRGWETADPEAAYTALTYGSSGAFAEGMVPGRRPTADAFEQFYPNSSAAGKVAGVLAPLALGPLTPEMAGMSMAERVMARSGQRLIGQDGAAGAAGRAAGGPPPLGPTPFGGRSMGAAEAGMTSDAGRLQSSGLGSKFLDELMGGAAEMTADQADLITAGVAQRLGFEELPGMRGRNGSPGRMWMASYMSHPSVRFAVQDTLENNVSRIEQLAMGALKAPDQRYGVKGLAAARERLGARFNALRDRLPEQLTLPAELNAGLQRVSKVAPELEDVMGEGGAISREDLFRLRTDLNLHAQSLMTAPGQALQGNRVGKLASQLDDFIRQQLGKDGAAEWKDTREGWLISELMQKPGVMQPDGSLSWKTMRGVLNREMPDSYRMVLEGERKNLSPATADFMDGIRWANAFGDLMPDSGTATRAAIGKLGVRDHVKAMVLRNIIRNQRDALNPLPDAEF